MRTLEDHLFGPGPKRILALDGGGVRGVMTCAILERLEDALRRRLPEEKRAAFRLCDYFDLIGGTSTGAIISAWLALGHTASETRALYSRFAARVFSNASLRSRIGLTAKFNAARLRDVIDEKFRELAAAQGRPPGDALRLNDRMIRTGLALFTKRIDKAAPWIVHNNPRGKFWDPSGELWKDFYAATPGSAGSPNASFSLSSFVQASASAPYYLDPITQRITETESAPFIDGAISPHNNPALYLFMMATLAWREPQAHMPNAARSPFGFGWETGEDKLLVVSLGTGVWRKQPGGIFQGLAGHKALHALTTMIDDASNFSVAGLQAISRVRKPYWLNHELEDMAGLRITADPLLSYLRIDGQLDETGLANLFGKEQAAQMKRHLPNMWKLDNPKAGNMARLAAVGEKLGERYFGTDADADQALPRSFDIA